MSMTLEACGNAVLDECYKLIRWRIWRTERLLVVSTIVVTIAVVSDTYSRRYRHHAFARFISIGASMLFLPIVSYIASGVGEESCGLPKSIQECRDTRALFLVILAILVQIVATNSCLMVAANHHEGRNIGSIVELLVRGIWTSYLAAYYLDALPPNKIFAMLSCAFVLLRVLVKLYAFVKTQRSFSHGRNPRLISGYMDQWKDEICGQHIAGDGQTSEFPLVVMGEDEQHVEEGPRGYRFRVKRGNESLVTISRIENEIMSSKEEVLHSLSPLKDLCLSFSLFKMLRRRFARCPILEEGSEIASNMMHTLFGADPESIFAIMADELSFTCDFYHSSLPITYSTWWVLILNIIFSFIGTTYCLYIGICMVLNVVFVVKDGPMSSNPYFHQISCNLTCDSNNPHIFFGSILFFTVLTFFLVIVVLFDEAWEIISYMCSNWTKVTLICYYITKTPWHQSSRMRRLILRILRFRCKLLSYSSDRMGQTSIMETKRKTGLVVTIKHLLRLLDQTKQVKIPTEVKAAIVNTLKSHNWRLQSITSLQHSHIGKTISWACEGDGTSNVILVWHITTCIFEIRHSTEPSTAHSISNKITATYLSQYGAYLLSSASELLPDDKASSKKSYESVKKIVDPIFNSRNDKHLEYEYMLLLLVEKSRGDMILNKGLTLGKQLVEGVEDEEMGWRVLAGFWSDMILYIAPSDNMDAHRRAIARGGELITILWALLTHAGILTRASPSSGV